MVSRDGVAHMPFSVTQQPILFSYPMPPFPSLIGTRLDQQIVEHDRVRFDEELCVTRAAEVVIGIRGAERRSSKQLLAILGLRA